MGKYVIKRIGYMLVVALVLSILMFLLYNLLPANRAYTDAKADMQAMKNTLRGKTEEQKQEIFNERYHEYQKRYGTDTKNMAVRYLRWVGLYPNAYDKFDGLLQGNFGYSYEHKKTVLETVKDPMLNTMKINIIATILGLGITIPLGIYCSTHKGKKTDQFVQVVTIIGYSLPAFITCIVFIWIFCSLLGWFPPSGMKTPGTNYTGITRILDELKYLALPLITMTFCSLGGMTRYVRAAMIDSLSLDCIRTARAKGVREKTVIYSHAWRNALIPIVTQALGWFLGIFSGSLMFENIFAINGMGKLMIGALNSRDYDLIILLQMFYVVVSLIGYLVIDIVYGLVDPRVRVNK